MDIVNTLTLRHIRAHKKRSVLTVLAIIVSVAMVTAVFTSVISFVKYFQNISKAVDGEWHICYEDRNYRNHLSALSGDENINTYGVCAGIGSIEEFDGILTAASRNYLDMRNIRLSEGRYPKDSSEIIAVENQLRKEKLDWKVGTVVELTVIGTNGSEKRSFRVVGMTDSRVSATDRNVLFTFADSDTIEKASPVLTYIRYNKLDNKIWDCIDGTMKNLGIENYSYNKELFAYSFVLKDNDLITSLGLFGGILLLIIAVVSIFMIYDSFAVSYQERAKYLGMLASVGATKKQKRASVYFEGLIFGLIGIPIGTGAGIGGIAVTFRCIEKAIINTISVNYDKPLRVYVNLFVIIGTIIASALTIFISAYIPARKASNTTAIEAIRQNSAVKIRKVRKLKVSGLAGKLLGYEGVLAIKNFKRNGKRSRNIVFSLALSFIVFVTAANFSSLFRKSMEMSFVHYSDIYVYLSDANDYEEVENIIKSSENVKGFSGYSASISPAKSGLTDEAKKYSDEPHEYVIFLDNASFDSYLKQLGEKNTEKYHNPSAPLAIVHNTAVVNDGAKKLKITPFAVSEGDKLDFDLKFYTDEKPSGFTEAFSVNIGKVTEKDWDNDDFYYQKTNLPLVILPIDYALSYYKSEHPSELNYTFGISCSNPEDVAEELNNKFEKAGTTSYANDANSQMETETSLLTIVNVFVYGFITLISIISVLNIINTISNSMNERKREFAMIRSVGMTPESFRKMIYYESFRYGIMSLVWAVPVSVILHIILYRTLAGSFDYGFIPNIPVYLIAAAAVFAIIFLSLLYSVGRIRNDNIIETLKEDIN